MKTEEDMLLDDIIEIQSLAQAGLYYTKDVYDQERFERLRDISAHLLSLYTDIPMVKLQNVFCHEVGYQTPKLDTRGVIFNENGEILMVQEKNGLWSLPGGWVDINTSIKENVEKEVYEEAGLKVHATQIIAIMARDKHNLPRYLYKIIKIFVMCEVDGGSFQKNIETTDSHYFSLDQLPKLSKDRNTFEQIKICFDAYHDQNWKTYFD